MSKITYSEKLRDPRWQKMRLRVMERDCFACRDCDSATKTLNVHHCFYERGEPWNTDPDFLLTLCDDCHDNRQKMEDEIKMLMGRFFSNAQPATIKWAVANLRNAMADDPAFGPQIVSRDVVYSARECIDSIEPTDSPIWHALCSLAFMQP